MKLRALLELMRVSNLPTVWSNAAVGALAGTLAWLEFDTPGNQSSHSGYLINNPELIIVSVGIPAFILSLLYCSGMVLNDYWDSELDAKERPSRPIPSGRVSPKQARNIAIGLMLAGVFFPAMNTGAILVDDSGRSLIERLLWGLPPLVVTLLLVLCIVAYNRLHSGRPSSVLLMALCRLLAIFTAGVIWMPWPNSVFWWLFIAGPGLIVGAYTLAISIVARREVEPGEFDGPKVVMNMIAAMPLLDAAWLLVMGLWPASLFCVGCSVLTKLGHRKVAGS